MYSEVTSFRLILYITVVWRPRPTPGCSAIEEEEDITVVLNILQVRK
jgi:hypothetical protein